MKKTQCYAVEKHGNMHISSYFERKKMSNVKKIKKHNTYGMIPLLVVAIFVDACIAETISIWHLGFITRFLILILKTQIATHYV